MATVMQVAAWMTVMFGTTMAMRSKIETEYRTEFDECHPGEPCTDVFTFVRNRRDAPVNETRFIHNCYCPGTQDVERKCPSLHEHEHVIFDTHIHKQILCENVNDMRPCRGRQVAQQLLFEPEHNNYHNYFRVMCICPRHLHPVWPLADNRIYAPATRKMAEEFDWDEGFLYHDYRCTRY